MRFSSLLLLPLGLTFASPAPKPVAYPEAIAAPGPTPAARLSDRNAALIPYPEVQNEPRQLSITLLGATAIVSNGVICGGILFLTGCIGTPGTATVRGTIRQSSNGGISGTIVDDDSTVLFGIPIPSSTGTRRTSTVTTNGGGAMATERPGKMAVAAGMGALALAML